MKIEWVENRPKNEVTVLVSANMTGTEKLKLLVIGKAQTSRFSKCKPPCNLHRKSETLDGLSNIFG